MSNEEDVMEMDAKSGSKEYVVAYSIREQKRANDLSAKWLLTVQIIFILLVILVIALYLKLDSLNVLSSLVTR